MPKDYDSLRKFYSQFESKDQESVVLKAAPAVAGVGRKLSARRRCQGRDAERLQTLMTPLL